MRQTQQIETAPWDAHLNEYEKALIAARLREQRDTEARCRQTFGECLRIIVELGIPERQARPCLGKWRKDYPDDLIHRCVEQARKSGAVDPIPFITAALKSASDRISKTAAKQTAGYRLLGWERPRITRHGATYTHGTRGQVWLDEFQGVRVLPAPTNMRIPSLDEDAGYDCGRKLSA